MSKRLSICPHCNLRIYGPRGRCKVTHNEKIIAFRKDGFTIEQIAKMENISHSSVYRVLREEKNKLIKGVNNDY